MVRSLYKHRARRWFIGLFALSLVAGAFALPVGAATQTSTFNVTADTFSAKKQSNAPRGSADTLRVSKASGNVRATYLAFRVEGLSGTLKSVNLKLKARNTTKDAISVAVTSAFTEASAGTSFPAAGTKLGTLTATTRNQVVNIPLGGVVQNGMFYVVLSGGASKGSTNFVSREGGSPAQLVVVTETVAATSTTKAAPVQTTTTTKAPVTTTTTKATSTTSTTMGSPTTPTNLANFFPLGPWMQPTSSFAYWKDLGMNTMIEVPQGHDIAAWSAAARAQGLKYIRVPQSNPVLDKGDNSLLAWAQHDEPELHLIPASDIQATYRQLKAVDPNKPVYLNMIGGQNHLDRPDFYNPYIAGTDWFSADYYPINNGWDNDIFDVGDSVTKMRKLVNDQKPVFSFVETNDFNPSDTKPGANGANGDKRGPTPDEVRAEIWVSIIRGARGVFYFPIQVGGGFNFNTTPAPVAAEIKKQNAIITSLAPVLQSAIDPKTGFTATMPVTSSPSVYDPGSIIGTWRNTSQGKYVIVMNQSMARDFSSTNQTFTVSGTSATSATVVGENRTVPIVNGKITDNFPSYVQHIYKMNE